MNSLAESINSHKKQWLWASGLVGFALLWFAIATPNLLRSRYYADQAASQMQLRDYTKSPAAPPVLRLRPAASEATERGGAASSENATSERRIVRTSSIEMVAQHPAEAAAQIESLAERVGGYLESSSGGFQDAHGWTMTIRVPVDRFDEVRTAVQRLGLRIESEKVNAQDVTQQYVDEEATLRNLRAEEAQYLAILKQARTVKDMLTVSGNLSAVRGQIERQQAEFNTLAKQVETVAITIALRAETEVQVFGLNWRPLYQMKLALRDGLESVANYATVMISVLFYLPAVVLWVGTILSTVAVGWKTLRWVGRRWLGWSEVTTREASVQTP